MEIPVTQLPPGDPRLVEAIVGQLKSKGIFDQFRKECLADVDTKPAFQNLRQRVEGHVNKFLEKKTWKNDMNKNQLRDGVRKHVNNLGILDSGIDAIITQVVNPKIKPLILPYVEDTVYAFLQIDKPKRERRTSVEPHVSPVFLEEKEEEPELKHEESLEEKKPILLPMETDVISSEEDDILARESPEAASKSSSSSEEEEIKTLDENAQDGFESCPPCPEDSPDDIVSTVERLQLSEDDSKSVQAAKQTLPLFEDQSLDSISSNSSGLTFSPLTVKGSPESKKSHDDAAKSDESPRTAMRSATSTPLVDEKPVDESSQSSLGSHHSKEFQASEKVYPGGHEASPPSLSAFPSSARPGKDGTSLMSFDEDSLESKESSKISMASGKSEMEEKVKSEKSEGEITSSSSEFSDGDTKGRQEHMSSEGRPHSDHDSSHKLNRSKSDHKKSRDSHSRDREREREKEKDPRHHRDKERKHSKSRDDHHSHRDKDKKHHRRDKDHDGDRERSRSHYHQSSGSSHKEGSGSKDKDRSSHHSSGKSSEGKSRSNHSSEKSEGKSHKKDEKHHQASDRKSESKSDGKREKRSEERTDRKSDKPDKKPEKKERSDEKLNRKPESKSEAKSDSQESKMEDKPEGKKDKTNEETESKSENQDKTGKSGYETSPREKKPEISIDGDSKKRKRSHRHKEDAEMLYDDEIQNENENENLVCETLSEECEIDDAHIPFLNGDIIVADDEGNFMLLTYEDDTDSLSSNSQMAGKIEDCSLLEMPLETIQEEEDCINNFEGFENTKADTKLADYLLKVVKVPDEMDVEYGEWFDESDLHMTLYDGTWDEKIPMSDFLKCVHQLGAVVRNDKGEVEEQRTSCVTSVSADWKENNNIHPVGKRRRISNSSSISSSSSSTGSPKHKRFRRECSAVSDTSQMLEQDAVIVRGYALLTPEDDGNRSMSREYDLDYSQKISNYSPLSPASDSSADEGKAKNRGTVVNSSNDIVKQSTKVDQKTDTSWPSKEVKFSV